MCLVNVWAFVCLCVCVWQYLTHVNMEKHNGKLIQHIVAVSAAKCGDENRAPNRIKLIA